MSESRPNATVIPFGDLRLPVGTRIKLEFVGRDYKRYPVEGVLLGWRSEVSLIMQLPPTPPQVLLSEGMRIEARLALQSGVITFQTTLDCRLEQPFEHFHLVWPRSAMFEPLRATPRFAFDHPLQASAQTALGVTTARAAGRFLDISQTGARVALDRALTSIVTRLQISATVTVAGCEQQLRLTAEVRRTFDKTGSGDFPHSFGLVFVDMQPPQRLLLYALCHQLQGNLPWWG